MVCDSVLGTSLAKPCLARILVLLHLHQTRIEKSKSHRIRRISQRLPSRDNAPTPSASNIPIEPSHPSCSSRLCALPLSASHAIPPPTTREFYIFRLQRCLEIHQSWIRRSWRKCSNRYEPVSLGVSDAGAASLVPRAFPVSLPRTKNDR